MNWHWHTEASQIVRRNWPQSQAFLLAQREPCITIRDDEIAHANRWLVGGMPQDLDAWSPPASWMIAVIVCQGDDTQELTRYVVSRGIDPERVHFYLHASASKDALAAWAEAGLPLDHVEDENQKGKPITDWASLHPILGLDLNLHVLNDFLEGPPPNA